MQFPSFHDLTTPRLLLRRITAADRTDYFRLFSDPRVARYMNWEPHSHIRQTDAALEKLMGRYSCGRYYRWGIALPEDNRLIGIIELLHFSEEENTCSFAYMLLPECWGKGYGTEALSAAFGFAFSEMRMEAVITEYMAPNLASGAAMKKAGMEQLKTIPAAFKKNGEVYDGILCRITRENWQKRN